MPQYPTIEACIGNTPLVRLQRLPGDTSNTILAKLEGTNPAGSVKDRPALSMIVQAEERGEIEPGDTLIEATSGNTGIALAMAAAIRGYRLILIMPAHMSQERKLAMSAYGAELLEVSQQEGMERARDLALEMQAQGRGTVLDQFGNPDNPRAHLVGTGPELWQQTGAPSPTWSAPWAPLARSWAVPPISNSKIRIFRSLACSPWKGPVFPVYGAGRKPTCQGSTRLRASIV